MSKKSNDKKQEKSSWLLRNKFLTLSCGTILSIIFVLLILLAMVFSPKQQLPKNPNKFSSSTFTKVALYSKLAAVQGNFFTNKKLEYFEVKLSIDEVNLFLKMLIKMQRTFYPSALDIPQLKDFKDKKINLFLDENQLIVGFSGKSNYWTPFGSYINVETAITPYIEEGNENITINKIKAGSLNIPIKNMVNNAIKKELSKPKNAQYIKLIKKLSIKDDILTFSIDRKEFFALVPIDEYLRFLYRLLRQ